MTDDTSGPWSTSNRISGATPVSCDLASDKTLIELGVAVLETEMQALQALIPRVRANNSFAAACRSMLRCQGRVVVTGMGKSGHIAGKVAATLASAGTPAFFLHPGEASHGDLGMITRADVVMVISNSGETDEILTILPLIKRLGVPLITLAGNRNSRLAREADVYLDVSVEKEACPLGLAPTSSTTAALAMGDALAIALLDIRGFGPEDFARSHPSGRLGKRLLLRIRDVMHTGDGIPRVAQHVLLKDALMEMTRKSLGMTAIVDEEKRILGIFTDGDLRRALDKRVDVHRAPISKVMTRNCVTATADLLAAEALNVMQTQKINALLVENSDGHLIGALNMHDLLRAGVI
jgi:arabinose-5-phosphate isomerase